MKHTFLLLIILSTFMVDNSTAQTPMSRQPDFIGRIDEDMLRMIVNIEKVNGFTGTGFLINQGTDIFLVTNKHMIGEYSFADPFLLDNSIKVFFYPEKPTSIIEHTIYLKDSKGNQSPNVRLHPDADVDIAVIKINNVYNENPLISRNYLSTGYLKMLSDIGKETHLGFGSQVFTIGYPAGFKLATSNYPIAKAAFIASSLSGKLEIVVGVKNRSSVVVSKKLSKKFFLADGLIVGGNSGGPIISPKDFYYKINDKQQAESLMYKSENYIIGIVSSGWPSTGLTIIYPCDYILELLR